MNRTLFPDIDWVGYIDWTVRDFHSFTTAQGATYNSYLIRDVKTAVIDTVKSQYASAFLKSVAELTPLDSVDFIVSNHAEPDHSGSITAALAACRNAVLLCNAKCRAALGKHYDIDQSRIRVVSSGETISLGRRSLTFADTPMVHWPESMATYVREDGLLFSMDAFGEHYAFPKLFDDENDLPNLMREAKRYYANIVSPYGPQVVRALDSLKGLDIRMIAPSHGVVWRKHLDAILSAYREWSSDRPIPKVLVIYDSMWGSTEMMARAILDGANRDGVDVKLISIRSSDLTEIATEAFDAACVAFGSSTINQTIMPMAGAALTYLKGLSSKKKTALAFGSYGWGKGGATELHDLMKTIGWEMMSDPLRSQFRPTAECLAACRTAGEKLAERALEACG